jgi:dTDP-4-amino-4,6-dideoxygalactose transaminase
MSATTLAILQCGATPVYHDVNPKDWCMEGMSAKDINLPVSLYGLHFGGAPEWCDYVDDAAQTFRPHNSAARFTSYSMQRSKLLNTGEGGVLATNEEELARRVRWFISLGYDLAADSSLIDASKIKSPDYNRHIPAWWTDREVAPMNFRMNPITAQLGLSRLKNIDDVKRTRFMCAELYAEALQGVEWIQKQYIPEGWEHDFWTAAFAVKAPQMWRPLVDAIVRFGGERPYAAWKLSYQEKAFTRYAPSEGCPNAESLQPRLVQFQTNNLESAERNSRAVRKAIEYIDRLLSVTSYESKLMQGTISGMPCE